MSLPSSYKRAVFKEAGAPLTLEQVQLTMPAAGEVLVKVEACGVCHSDTIPQAYGLNGQLYAIQHLPSVSSKLMPASPIVPGHEIIGHVAAVGDQVSQWQIGDRIGGPWHGGHDGASA